MISFVHAVETASIAYIWLVHDHEEEDGNVNHWYHVALEPIGEIQGVIQTIEFTVTYGGDDDPTKYLEPILAHMGWTGEIQNAHQGYGHEGRTVIK